ncbi:MAG: phosphatase PAP2 family protein [Methanofollis sp.]|uniref:phosphatase PAP2 family protein n=1 Tax=Methanofollis sp. TaxID=2052835 RepID=UPI0026394276|nr:phosphatase PAP2 family protein [Methanofollis sp.]MDD4253899.1 phosphatase PAP2 family protein [Methanofollis sp.]
MDPATAEIGWVVLAQAYLGGLEPLMHAASALGTPFFFFVIAAVWWCANPRAGLRLGLLLAVSGGINAAAKLFFHTPRPYWMSTEVQAHAVEPTFSMPSGHAQNAVCFWGYAAFLARERWFLAVAIGIVALTGISRVVLGVHFPRDVLAGWLIGAAVLLVFLALEEPAAAWIGKFSPAKQAGLAFSGSLILLALSVIPFLLFRAPIPEAWNLTAVDPWDLSNALYAAGAVFGIGAGAAWEGGRFTAGGGLRQRAARLAAGIAGAALIWAVTAPLIAAGPGPAVSTAVYLRAAALGLWISGAAPRLFDRLGIAG